VREAREGRIKRDPSRRGYFRWPSGGKYRVRERQCAKKGDHRWVGRKPKMERGRGDWQVNSYKQGELKRNAE